MPLVCLDKMVIKAQTISTKHSLKKCRLLLCTKSGHCIANIIYYRHNVNIMTLYLCCCKNYRIPKILHENLFMSMI